MSTESVIKFLKMAEEYRQCYPGLTVGYAIGLTVFDSGLHPGAVERCATLAGKQDISKGYPGGDITKQEYDDMYGRYEKMKANLRSGWNLELDLSRPNTLSETITRLRGSVAD